MKDKVYRQSVMEWRNEREESLRKENGWLALTGLFWLEPGKNRLGSGPECEIRLPQRLPAEIGFLEHNSNTVTLHTLEGQKVRVNEKLVDFAILQPDISEEPSFITLQEVRFVVIQRGKRFGIRVWDNQREERRLFPARTWYDIDERYRLPAKYNAYDEPKLARFPGLAGEKSEFPVDGYLAFEFEGHPYRLDITKEDEGSYFVRFRDPTSKDTTYPTGRYLVAEVQQSGEVFLDFNKSYNPPCAFTEYATCIFAPRQNHLDFRVEAGETYQRR
jgi:uncharacterized protein (DUF1684 family)